MDKTMLRAITELRKTLVDLAEAAVMQPKAKPFGHGTQVGKYQGVLLSLDVIDNILNEESGDE